MPKIKVDEIEYNSEDLSDHGLATLKSLQFLEGQLQKLKSEIAINQTARQAYIAALKHEINESGITSIPNEKDLDEED